MRGTRLALVALLATACNHRESATAPTADARVLARDAARDVLAPRCGSCHERHLATAIDRALVVYDLDDDEWPARMSDAQLDSASWRLGELLPPDGRPSDATPAERAAFARFVAVEKQARHAAPACPPDDLLEAIHAAIFRLEHEGVACEVGTVDARVHAPLDETTRSLIARLHAAAIRPPEEARNATEALRAELAAWRCLDDARHQRFHAHLAR